MVRRAKSTFVWYIYRWLTTVSISWVPYISTDSQTRDRFFKFQEISDQVGISRILSTNVERNIIIRSHTCLSCIYSRAGGSTVSYVHLYQVRNTLLRINYLTRLVSTMALSGFGPYHGMSLEDAQTKCVDIIPTPWAMTHALGLVPFPSQHK